MKRILCLILSLTLLMLAATPVLAVENENTVTPRYTYIGRIYSGLTINSLGLSACNANGLAPTAASVKLTCKLQRYNGSSWTTVKTWTATGTDYASVSKNYAVYSGYTYRLSASFSVYNASGVLVESGTCYSNQVVY